MKRFAVVLASVVVLMAAVALAQDQGTMTAPATLKFTNFPNFPKCVTGAVVHGDPGSDQGATILAKLTAGCSVPWHFHSVNEQIGIVSGSVKAEMKDAKPQVLGPGGFAFFPAKHVHQATCTTACMFFIATEGKLDIHYVDKDGNEIPFDQAVKTKPAAAKSSKAATKK